MRSDEEMNFIQDCLLFEGSYHHNIQKCYLRNGTIVPFRVDEGEEDVANERDVKLGLPDARIEEMLRLEYEGVSPDAPTVENERGGKQSKVEGDFSEIPPIAMFELAKVMQHGAEKYGSKNWHNISVPSHLNHLLMHIFAYLAGDRQEHHLVHALARAAMAVEVEARDGA